MPAAPSAVVTVKERIKMTETEKSEDYEKLKDYIVKYFKDSISHSHEGISKMIKDITENSPENCRISSTTLGTSDHGILTFNVWLEFNGGGQGLGGYALDQYDKNTEERSIGYGPAIIAVRKILDTVGVENWEDLKGKLCRAKFDTLGSSRKPIIGHIIEDKWFDLEVFMEGEREEYK